MDQSKFVARDVKERWHEQRGNKLVAQSQLERRTYRTDNGLLFFAKVNKDNNGAEPWFFFVGSPSLNRSDDSAGSALLLRVVAPENRPPRRSSGRLAPKAARARFRDL
jgi:hypothetical protein